MSHLSLGEILSRTLLKKEVPLCQLNIKCSKINSVPQYQEQFCICSRLKEYDHIVVCTY